MEKISIQLKSKQQTKLTRLANREHVSIDEINKRAIDAYDPVKQKKLEQLLDLLNKSADNAIKAADEALKEMSATINYLRQKEGNKNEYQ